MIRWLKELIDPALKCARRGHLKGVAFRRGYLPPSLPAYSIIDKVRQHRSECRRCGAVLGEWETVYRTGLTSYSWPESQMEAFDRDREYWHDHGWLPL